MRKNIKLIVWVISVALCVFCYLVPDRFSFASTVEEYEKKFHEIQTIYRKIGLLESLDWFDSLDPQDPQRSSYAGPTKDNVWIVGEGVSVFVRPYRDLRRDSSVLSQKEAENHRWVRAIVVRGVFDTTNEHLLIPRGARVSGPTEVKITDGRVMLTITSHLLQDPVKLIGGSPDYLIKPRIKPGTFWPEDFPGWNAEILKNPPLSATLFTLESEDIDDTEIDSSKMRLSRDTDGQLYIHLPETIELTVRRPLYFSYPWFKDNYIPRF